MTSRLASLRARPRKPGEASFFWFEAQFGCEAVKVMPGEYFVDDDASLLIMTTLGSCIATCLWDRRARVGGLNHFMLPEGDGDDDEAPEIAGRYGLFAMELLVNELLKRGASRATLDAKGFGGGQVVAVLASQDIGERNTRFVLDYLQTERIAVVSSDVRGIHARKVCFLPATGKALVRRLAPARAAALVADEGRAALRVLPSAAGSVDLF